MVLSQKYGYAPPDYSVSSMLKLRKDPLQIFYGLEPGWIVNLKEKSILKPEDPLLKEYYSSDWISDSRDKVAFTKNQI